MQHYGTPRYLRSDHGPEFVAIAVQQWLTDNRVKTAYTQPGKPWQNGVNESFFDKLRDECLNMEWFVHLPEAKVVLNACRKHYNEQRPHSSLGYQTPHEVALKERAILPNLTLSLAL